MLQKEKYLIRIEIEKNLKYLEDMIKDLPSENSIKQNNNKYMESLRRSVSNDKIDRRDLQSLKEKIKDTEKYLKTTEKNSKNNKNSIGNIIKNVIKNVLNNKDKKVDEKIHIKENIKEIRRSPYFLYLIQNKDRLIQDLKNKSIEYQKIQKKNLYGKYYYDTTNVPIPGDSLTDRIHKLLYYELKTNVDLIAFQSLSATDRRMIESGQELEVQVNFDNENIKKTFFNNEKYEKVYTLHQVINSTFSLLCDKDIDTNNKLISKMKTMRAYRGNSSVNRLIHDLRDLSQDEKFYSDQRRFFYFDRNDENHDKKFKIKHDDGFMTVAEGYKFGGNSSPIPVIKRIFVPGYLFNKYQNTWIQKKDKISPTTEIYKAKVLELLGVSKNKIRLQSTNWNVEYIKMNENTHILSDAVRDKNFSINKKDLVKNVLISYLFFIGDRNHGNILDDMSHIDFGIDRADDGKYLRENLEDSAEKNFFKYIENNDFKNVQEILYESMDRYSYRGDILGQFKNIPESEFKKYCNEALNEISKSLTKDNLKELNKINEDYKKDMKKNNYKAPSNLFFLKGIQELSNRDYTTSL